MVRKRQKRLLSLFLTLFMLFSILPTRATAYWHEEWDDEADCEHCGNKGNTAQPLCVRCAGVVRYCLKNTIILPSSTHPMTIRYARWMYPSSGTTESPLYSGTEKSQLQCKAPALGRCQC